MNKHIKRYLEAEIERKLKPNKVFVLYGPRQVGKTTLINEFLKSYKGKVYKSTGENAILKEILASNNFEKITSFFSDYDLIFIDEAQLVPNIGLALKIIVDQIPGARVIATGSSSFELSNKVGEPLVGRQSVNILFPVSVLELKDNFGTAYVLENLENLLVYGSYPSVLTADSLEEKREYLAQVRDSYLYKDLILIEEIKHKDKMLDLLRLLAFQIGQEVSLKELAGQLEISRVAVERYLYLLEQAFVIKKVRGFSRNLRKEITKTSRYYFYDNGIRNAVIDNFHGLKFRNDIGQLWENFLFIERMKKREYKKIYANMYFWRTWDQKEIDLVEEREGKLYGYEFKWNSKKKSKAPKDWLEAYENAEYEVIDKDNFLDFLS